MEKQEPNNIKPWQLIGFILISLNFIYSGYKLFSGSSSVNLFNPTISRYIGLFLIFFFATIVVLIIKKYLNK
jgi:hypothetical protein